MRKITVVFLFSLFFISCITQGFGVYHKVGKNENIRTISELYGVEPSVLRSENQIPEDVTVLDEGVTIFIPGAKEIQKYEEKKIENETIEPDKSEMIPSEKQADYDETAVNFQWPAAGNVAVPFGGEFENRNEGIDIELSEGTEVRASADGKVLFSASHGGFGNMVIIQHNERFISVYAHLQANVAKEGQLIKQGELVGFSGMTGVAATPRLHFEIREYSKPVDPLKYLKK